MAGIKASELVELAKQCQRKKTLYAKGAFGAPLNDKNKTRYKVDAPTDPNTFLFDCCGLWHALCSGWCADSSHVYGGTQVNKEQNGISYGAFHIPDNGADGCFSSKYLQDISNDMNNVLPGEILWVPGHNGICVKPGWAIECTPKWKGGVQISQWLPNKV